jgi:hypothetical protein
MGRRKLSAAVKRSEVFSFRITKSELKQIAAASKKAKLDPKDWARKCLIENSGGAKVPS